MCLHIPYVWRAAANLYCILCVLSEEWKQRYEKEKDKNQKMKTLLTAVQTELQRWRSGKAFLRENCAHAVLFLCWCSPAIFHIRSSGIFPTFLKTVFFFSLFCCIIFLCKAASTRVLQWCMCLCIRAVWNLYERLAVQYSIASRLYLCSATSTVCQSVSVNTTSVWGCVYALSS